MPNSENYETIYEAMTYEVPVAAKYKGKDRKFWPIVLGNSPKGGPAAAAPPEEMVLGLEFELGGVPHVPPVWRCYKVKWFSGKVDPTSGPDKPDLGDDIGRQNCVITPDPRPVP
jgi:hypothetical protein